MIIFGEIGKEIKILWEEYEEQKTRDSNYVKALDKVEPAVRLISLTKYDSHWEYTINRLNNALVIFPEIKSFVYGVRQKLKNEYKTLGREWKPEWDEV